VKISCISENGISEEVVLSDSIFDRAYNESLVHQIVNSYMANGRAGTRAQKGRSEVAKTTRKQWRQKGTGRARAGAASNPIWRGGGNIFPNRPDEKFSQKVNRKMYRAGICTIVSQLLRDNRLHIVDEFIVSTPKTKDFLQKLQKHQLKNALIITDVMDDNLYLASRNVPNIRVVELSGMDPVSLLHYENVVMTRETIGKFESALL
jgi:large subunit ribosomal protein L4